MQRYMPCVTGHTTTEVFASGGVHALIRLLENVLEFAAEPQRSVWVREVLALLYPLVRRSRMVARLLVRPLVPDCPNNTCPSECNLPRDGGSHWTATPVGRSL